MVVLLAMAAAHSLASTTEPAVVDDPLAERPRVRGTRRDRLLREGRGRGRRRQGLAAMSSAALEQTKAMPSEEQVDGATTLEQLRAQEAAILETQRRHEEALARLQARYQKVRKKMYTDHKKEVISQDNARLAKFQGGCAKPKRLSGLSKAEADEQAPPALPSPTLTRSLTLAPALSLAPTLTLTLTRRAACRRSATRLTSPTSA